MREILFEGKRVDNGEWIEGYYMYNGTHIIVNTQKGSIGFGIQVIPETVREYTGLPDRNGRRILEGDIVRYNGWYDYDITAVVKIGEYQEEANQKCYGVYAEVVKYKLPEWADYFPDCARTINLLSACKYCECEVIGNIHDNPELLEAE